MKLKQQINQLDRMDSLIRRKATGCSTSFAQKMNVSVPTIYRYLEDLKSFGAPISYCRTRQSYYYTERFTLKFRE